jgi:hypothetical protein
MDKDEFKFPDETQVASSTDETEIEIEVVDDTPEDDRGRKPMKEAPAEVTDEELAQYSDGVKKRIQHFSKGYHEERRAKESALREREEALRVAQTLAEENKKLQTSLGQGQQALLEQAKKVVATELEDAKRAYKQAYESGDADKVLEAQEALTSAKIKADKVANFKPAPLQKEETPVKPETTATKQPEQINLDTKARAWYEANPWFGSNQRMTKLAMLVHDELVSSGVDPTSDEYYNRINTEVRETFPRAFSSDKSKKTTVVAPATRSTAPKKIVLTQSQVNIAKRLGVPLERYARQVAEDMRKQNG